MSTEIDRSPSEVWAYVRDISSHVDWMADAAEIRCIGPFRLTDVMTITSWIDEAEMGVRHEGLVTGVGRFILEPLEDGRARFTWNERLSFPIWFGGPIGEWVAKPILSAVWKRNLRRLRQQLESAS